MLVQILSLVKVILYPSNKNLYSVGWANSCRSRITSIRTCWYRGEGSSLESSVSDVILNFIILMVYQLAEFFRSQFFYPLGVLISLIEAAQQRRCWHKYWSLDTCDFLEY